MTQPLSLLAGAWLGYRIGQKLAYRDFHTVMGLVADGSATLNEDGTVELVETFVDYQREAAPYQ